MNAEFKIYKTIPKIKSRHNLHSAHPHWNDVVSYRKQNSQWITCND